MDASARSPQYVCATRSRELAAKGPTQHSRRIQISIGLIHPKRPERSRPSHSCRSISAHLLITLAREEIVGHLGQTSRTRLTKEWKRLAAQESGPQPRLIPLERTNSARLIPCTSSRGASRAFTGSVLLLLMLEIAITLETFPPTTLEMGNSRRDGRLFTKRARESRHRQHSLLYVIFLTIYQP